MKKSLTREESLRGGEELDRVFRNPEKMSHCRGAKLVVSYNKMRMNRFAAIPAKEIGKAVRRNRAKRIFREIYRNLKCKINDGYDIVVIAYGGDYEYIEREGQFLYLIRKAGIDK